MKDQSSKKELKSNKEGLKTKTTVTPNQETNPNQEANPNQETNPNQEANPNQEKTSNKRIKNTPLDDLRNLIETANIDRQKYVKNWKKNLQTNMEYWLSKISLGGKFIQ